MENGKVKVWMNILSCYHFVLLKASMSCILIMSLEKSEFIMIINI